MHTTNPQPLLAEHQVLQRSLIHEPAYDADAERLLGTATADSVLRFMHHKLASGNLNTHLGRSFSGTISDLRYAIDFRIKPDGIHLVRLAACAE